jgi:hypothetical protein
VQDRDKPLSFDEFEAIPRAQVRPERASAHLHAQQDYDVV